MKKEWILLLGSILVTLGVALAGIWIFFPQLLGGPSSLELVKVDRSAPAFYQNLINDISSDDYLVKDPLTQVRGSPFLRNTETMGPNDILGFRNFQVPNSTDVIVIGDSQTYGNNADINENWPSVLKESLALKRRNLYAMATGGWGAVQYYQAFKLALKFKPKFVVIAFYTGNDPTESFQLAYSIDEWGMFRVDPSLEASDLPKLKYPPPQEEWFPVKFDDGVSTIFTPNYRLASNIDQKAINTGYKIMAAVSHEIYKEATKSGVEVIFTIIPTKELVYAAKVEKAGLAMPVAYEELIKREKNNIQALAEDFPKGSEYVDVLTPLQQAALSSTQLYPEDANGHPVSSGYKVIGNAISDFLDHKIVPAPEGLVAIETEKGGFLVGLVNTNGLWLFPSGRSDLIEANGWPPQELPSFDFREVASLPYKGLIHDIDPQKFGPQSVK